MRGSGEKKEGVACNLGESKKSYAEKSFFSGSRKKMCGDTGDRNGDKT